MSDTGSAGENSGADGLEQPATQGMFGGSVQIVVGTIVLATIVIVMLWRKFLGTERKWKASGSLTPPEERDVYIQAKVNANLKDPLSKDELRKLLIKRALKAIPIIISLQNEGQSIDRLYKKGMLTDDMHFRVKELKAFVDQEYQDVQTEANELFEGWGEHVWQQAMQFHMMIQRQLEATRVQQQQVQQEKTNDKLSDNTTTSSSSSSSGTKVEDGSDTQTSKEVNQTKAKKSGKK